MTLTGCVERDYEHNSHGAAYGALVHKIPDATVYGIRGSIFNNPLFHDTKYNSDVTPLEGSDRDYGDAIFDAFTSGGGSGTADDQCDEQILAEFAWRFEGGEWYAFPGFFRRGEVQ